LKPCENHLEKRKFSWQKPYKAYYGSHSYGLLIFQFYYEGQGNKR